MTRRKDFLPAKASRKKKAEPLFIDFGDNSFEAKPKRNGAALLAFMSASSGAEDESETSQISRVLPFIYESLISADEVARFKEYIFDDENDVDVDVLVSVVTFLIESYSQRPTEASTE